MVKLALVLLVATLGAGCAASLAEDEFQPSADQLRDYYAVYDNADVKYLRKVFDRAASGSGGREADLLSAATGYLGRKFIVVSRDPLLAGGTQVTILFQGRADAVFSAWVYDRKTSQDRYELRGFRRVELSEDRLDAMCTRYRRFLEDPEHAM